MKFKRPLSELPLDHPVLTPAQKKDGYLKSITKDDGTYKTLYPSPIPYIGSKTAALGTIISRIPTDTTHIVSPFGGGLSLEISCAQAGMTVTAYDAYHPLINYWTVQLATPDELAAYLTEHTLPPTRELYKRSQGYVFEHARRAYKGIPFISLPVAAAYFYCHHLGFLPTPFSGVTTDQREFNEYHLRIKRASRIAYHMRTLPLSIDLGDFQDTIPYHHNAFLYCDPPYLLADNAKYYHNHAAFNHTALRDRLKKHTSGFILSYNDVPAVRELYQDWCNIHALSWYHPTKYKKGNELLITPRN